MAQLIAPSLEMLMPRRLLFVVLLVAGEFFFCHSVSLFLARSLSGSLIILLYTFMCIIQYSKYMANKVRVQSLQNCWSNVWGPICVIEGMRSY